MTTAVDIIDSSLQKLGVYAPGETLSDADAERGLTALNDMIDQWADEYLYLFSLVPAMIDLILTQGTYTIGAVASPILTQTRPSRILGGPGAASVTIGGVTTPVNVVSAVEWQAIESTSDGIGTPDTLHYVPAYPNGILHLTPLPDAVGTLSFSAWVPFRRFVDLFAPDATFAPGVEDTLKCSLAVALKPYFATAAIDPIVVAEAAQHKNMLQYSNLGSRALLGRGIGAAPAAPPAAPRQ